MLPYYRIIPYVVKLPSLTIVGGVFQTIIALGFVIALCKIASRSRQLGLEWEFTVSLAAVVAAFGYIGSHILWVLFYAPHILFQSNRWAELADVSGSISSVGGFISGALTFLCARLLLGKQRPWLQIGDLFLQATVLAMIFGRLACTLAHDHVSDPTSFPLAFAYPDATRHNLGFYELLFLLGVVYPLSLYLERTHARIGSQIIYVLALYSIGRFFLDFLRSTDEARYFSLTPAQYACILFCLISGFFFFKSHTSPPSS